MRTKISILLILGSVISSNFVLAQSTSGYVKDNISGEALVGALIYDQSKSISATTNEYGWYSLSGIKDNQMICCSYVGYEERCISYNGSQLDFMLTASQNSIDEITITAATNVTSHDRVIDRQVLDIKQIKKQPMLLGEVDILKSVQLLPGVQAGAEGQSGFLVRGGSPDQNLIILDGAPVYNVSHLFGFFSVFNGNAIKDVSFTKGGFPARYGGRLSSILDINMKDGNQKKHSGSISIGLLAATTVMEGPISPKTTYMLALRRTYADYLLGIASGNRNQGYYFYDGNAKLSHTFNKKNRLFFSLYGGRDQLYQNGTNEDEEFTFGSKFNLGWTNRTATLRWNNILNAKTFLNTSLIYSEYFLNDHRKESQVEKASNRELSYSFRYDSKIRDLGLKVDLDHRRGNHRFRAGGGIILHRFLPGAFDIREVKPDTSQNFSSSFKNSPISPLETYLYLEDEIDITDRLKVNAGLRAVSYDLGKSTDLSIQPRLSMSFATTTNSSIKASYSNMRQHLQLLVNDRIGLPIDQWLPSTEHVSPQSANQISLSYRYEIPQRYSFSIGAYTKKMLNSVDYKIGKDIYGFEPWQDKVTQGNVTSRGVELQIEKTSGKWTGMIAYTLSKTEAQFDDLNFGKPFPIKYDRRHDLSLSSITDLGKDRSISANFVYSSGIAYTLNATNYGIVYKNEHNTGIHNGTVTGTKNNQRLRPYHRLDLAYNVSKKVGRSSRRTWSMGLYNAYSRFNSVYATTRIGQDGKLELVERGFFPVIPFVSYKLEF